MSEVISSDATCLRSLTRLLLHVPREGLTWLAGGHTWSSEVHSLSARFIPPRPLADVHSLRESCPQVHHAHSQVCPMPTASDAAQTSVLLGTADKRGRRGYHGLVVLLKGVGNPLFHEVSHKMLLPVWPGGLSSLKLQRSPCGPPKNVTLTLPVPSALWSSAEAPLHLRDFSSSTQWARLHPTSRGPHSGYTLFHKTPWRPTCERHPVKRAGEGVLDNHRRAIARTGM